MEMKVYWTQFAECKLDDVFLYYSEKASVRIAQKLVEGIVGKSLELERNPLMGQKESLLADRIQEFRYMIYKNYKMIYWLNYDKNRIEIINLFDCRQDPLKISESSG